MNLFTKNTQEHTNHANNAHLQLILYTNMQTITHHTPAGASTYTFLHYGQEVSSGGFHAFDYGKEDNLDKYGTEDPPAYDLAKVTCPTAVYYADNDWLAQPQVILNMMPLHNI